MAKRTFLIGAVAGLALALASACAPLMPMGGLLYTGVQSSRQFEAGASSAAPGRLVYGEACAHGTLFLVAWGDASLDAALQKADALGRTLKNITVDHSQTNFFLFYSEYCTIVKAYVVENREEKRLREERENGKTEPRAQNAPPAREEKTAPAAAPMPAAKPDVQNVSHTP